MSLLTPRQVLEWCEHHKKDPEPLASATDDLQDDSRKKTTEVRGRCCSYCGALDNVLG